MTQEERIQELLKGSEAHLKDPKLLPWLAERVKTLIVNLASNQHVYFGAFMTYRTPEQQAALYAQGRQPLTVVNTLRKGAGLPAISELENKKTVTSLKIGLHNLGLAVDVVEDGNPDKAGIQWSWANNADYLKIGSEAKALGLEWGGFWSSFKDTPHVQITGGYSVKQLLEAYHLYGIEYVHQMIMKKLAA